MAGCKTCGDKPKRDRAFPSAVVEINNPEQLVLLRKVAIPASMGDDTEVPPTIGKYRNVILQYEANGHLYLYSSDGIPTKIDATVPQEVLDRITTLEGDVSELDRDLAAESDTRERADANLQQEIDDLKNSPDVVDIVATYADLMAYDTNTLGDKDVIRVLRDETHEGQSDYYRWGTSTQTWTFIGTVGDYYTKQQVDTLLDGKQDELTPGENVSIVDESGALVISATDTTYTAGSNVQISPQNVISATDTTYSDFTGTDGTAAGTAGLVPAPATTDAGKFLKADGTWDTAGGGGSAIKTLSTSDYNYPSNNPTSVALWLLDEGLYEIPASGVSVYYNSSNSWSPGYGEIVEVTKTQSGTPNSVLYFFGNTNGYAYAVTKISDGSQTTGYTRMLNMNDIVQATGTNQYAVMSQNAVTSMVFGSTTSRVKIGDSATSTSSNTIAIGDSAGASASAAMALGRAAQARHTGSVALGANTQTSVTGEIAIGATSTVYGYNSSNYRIISGVYDGQSAHDAATKGQLDSIAIQNAGAPTTSTVGTVGQLLEDTTNGDLYICTDATNPYVWEEVGAGGSGGGVIELTSADYNYPTDNPTRVALWLLEPGIYYAGTGVSVRVNSTTSVANSFYVVTQESSGNKSILVLYPTDTGGTIYNVLVSNGAGLSSSSITTSIVQTTGTSTTDVMSQNATTSMVYDDPSTRSKVKIGDGAYTASPSTVAIGKDSWAQGNGAIALGYKSYANKQGQMDIGSLVTSYGYNNSAYRLLTGLYDPQSAHDAATKGYVDNNIPATFTTNEWNALWA